MVEDLVLEGPTGDEITLSAPLDQPSILINFKPSLNFSCPPLLSEEKRSGHKLVLSQSRMSCKLYLRTDLQDSITTSMQIDGVTSIYKRFYHNLCHLQICTLRSL